MPITPAATAPRWQVEALAHYQRFDGLSGGDVEEGGMAVFFEPLLQASHRLCPKLSADVGAGRGLRLVKQLVAWRPLAVPTPNF